MRDIRELLSFSKSIFSSPSVGKVFLYFCKRGASTAWLLQSELEIPEATAYRALKKLRSIGVIRPSIKTSKMRHSKGGPRPVVWSVANASAEEISAATKLHFRTLNPKFRVAEDVAQTILDKFSESNFDGHLEITYREIVVQVRRWGTPFRAPDIADLTAEYLAENGVKIWR